MTQRSKGKGEPERRIHSVPGAMRENRRLSLMRRSAAKPQILPVKIGGMTSRFDGRGRSLGYPTANIRKVNIKFDDGVYFGFATLGKFKHEPALIFIGAPETFDNSESRVEAYLLDIPDEDYYDQKLMLSLEKFWRPNQKFASLNELKHAMRDDELAARKWFRHQ